MLKLFLFISALSFFLNSCGSIIPQKDQLKISISHSDIYCWLNLMPGGPSSFHIIGNLTIQNLEPYEIRELNLIEIILTQENKDVYSFEPSFESINENVPDKNLKAGEEKDFRFGVKTGLKIKPELESGKTITARLIFVSGEKVFEYIIPDIGIEKAY